MASVARRHLWCRVLIRDASKHYVVNKTGEQYEQACRYEQEWPESSHDANAVERINSHASDQETLPAKRNCDGHPALCALILIGSVFTKTSTTASVIARPTRQMRTAPTSSERPSA